MRSKQNYWNDSQQWQHLARDSESARNILYFLKDKQIGHSLFLTVKDWQTTANYSFNPHVLKRLA